MCFGRITCSAIGFKEREGGRKSGKREGEIVGIYGGRECGIGEGGNE